MGKKHHKKRSSKLIRTRRFSALVAILLVVVSAGLGYAWLRNSSAFTSNGEMFVWVYDITDGPPSQSRLIPNFPIRTYIVNAGQNCSNPVGVTDANGNFNFKNCPSPLALGLNRDLHYYQVVPNRSGYQIEVNVRQPMNQISDRVQVGPNTTALVALQVRKIDSDGDGVYDINDSCINQPGLANNRGCPISAPVAAAPKPPAATPASRSTATSRSIATTANPATTNAPSTGESIDAVPPSAPTSLKLTSPSSGLVALTWSAATDDTGVARYSVERSIDKVAWDMLNDNVIDTTYTDAEAGYAQKYYYRVIAYDAATNASSSVDGEIVTGQFQPNAKPDEEVVVTSDNSLVTVTMPPGAVEEEMDCRLTQQDDIEAVLPDGAEAKSPPYRLVCKKSDGSSLDTFRQPLRYMVSVDSGAMGDLTPALFTFADEAWSKSDTAYSADGDGFSLESDQAQTFIVAGIKQSNLIPMIITGLVLLLLAAAVVVWFIRGRRGGSDSQYSAANYMNGATTPSPVSVPAPTAGLAEPVTPGTPPATPVVGSNPINSTERPGQHGIHVPGEVKAPFEDRSDSSVPSISHHSPLDRLDDQSKAGSDDQLPR